MSTKCLAISRQLVRVTYDSTNDSNLHLMRPGWAGYSDCTLFTENLLCAERRERMKDEKNLIGFDNVMRSPAQPMWNGDQNKIWSPSLEVAAVTGYSQWPVVCPSLKVLRTFSFGYQVVSWVLSSPPDCDVLEYGDCVLSYLKSSLIREFPVKPHCFSGYLFFSFPLWSYLWFDRASFWKPLEPYIFPFKAQPCSHHCISSEHSESEFPKVQSVSLFMCLTWWATCSSLVAVSHTD